MIISNKHVKIIWQVLVPSPQLSLLSVNSPNVQNKSINRVRIKFNWSLNQSSGIPSLSPSGQPTTFTRSNVYWKHTFLTFSTDVTYSSPCCYFNCFNCFICFTIIWRRVFVPSPQLWLLSVNSPNVQNKSINRVRIKILIRVWLGLVFKVSIGRWLVLLYCQG